MIRNILKLSTVSIMMLSCTTTTHQYIIDIPTSKTSSKQAQKLYTRVAISAVKLPSYLLEHKIAKRGEGSSIEYLDTHKWAEKLDVAFKREMQSYLQKHLVGVEMVEYPWGTMAQRVVEFQIHQFIAQDKSIALDATLKVFYRKTNQTKRYALKSSQGFSGKDEDIAGAMNAVFEEVLHKIGNILSKKN